MSIVIPDPVRTKRVTCKQCLAETTLPEDVDPHSVAWCECCTEDHHHGEGATACSPDQHNGEPCWNPPSVPRPEGCGVCRPIIHHGTTVSMSLVAF